MRFEQLEPVMIRTNGNSTVTMKPVIAPIVTGSGSGDVTGPASSTADNIVAFNGTTGKALKDSGKAHSTDGTLASNSDAKIPTEKAVKTYADTKQTANANLTTLAGLTPTTNNFIVAVGSAWASRTVAQVKTTLALVVADISDFASSVASAITAERTAVRTLTNVTLTAPTMTTPALGTPASGNLANCTFPTLNQSTTGSAATLTTSRTIGTLTGDVTSAGSGFNGSANNTNAATLATVNSNVGSFGSASSVATFTVNGKGLVTAAGATSIAIPSTAVSDFAEAVRDTMGTALVEGTGIDITVNDGGDTITIAATGGGGGGGTVDAIVAGTNIDVDNTDPANPIVSVEALTAADLSDFDTEVSNNTDVAANTAARHTHSNASVLNATTASFTTADETKLDGIAAGATTDATVTAHIGTATDAHDASAISFEPSFLIITTEDVQAALIELEEHVDSNPSIHNINQLDRTTAVVSGTTYTILDSDHGKRIQFTNAGSIAVTVPNTLRSDFVCDWEQFGAGVPTFTGSSCTVRARGGATKSAGQYAVGGLSRADSDEFLLYGDITT